MKQSVAVGRRLTWQRPSEHQRLFRIEDEIVAARQRESDGGMHKAYGEETIKNQRRVAGSLY